MQSPIDDIDRKIMKLLQHQARMPISQISQMVAMSQPAVKERIMKLEEKGFITGYRTEFNLQRLERGTTSFILMKTEQCQALVDFCEQAPEVTDLHRISGEFNYLIKVKTASVEELADFQDSIAGMGPSKSLISLKNLLENRVVL
ncbi:Lrp/AsnC family transcriptional regulator [Paenibacillus lautus]|uniref:Lrp/AsnC family transcriptional regulator n=1 Tax=Paenibacillus lautus TaxID=1401 RepID=UPI002DBC87EF|nr:Lrp/AsnC family transcriptional regulator [Paenibacillus lautus]MEC0305859.1 Lrp/AsnC family transcriptional regulator [Paenibacillus lautus]